MSIVTRFAPSPTGYLHIGSLRTVLFNYLFTKQNDGKFLLRIEDTDRSRYVEGSIENLLQVLASVGLIPDEGPNNPGVHGPYLQSERLDIYRKYIDILLEKDMCYHCFCTPERLTELREEQQSLGLPTKYDKKCRYLSVEEIKEKLDAGIPYTIRLKVPENITIEFEDTVRGKISIESKDVDDQVLLKTDEFPTYHFAVVVDDHLMEVTDIIRGDEWIPSTPKHILLYRAFGWSEPKFSHVPPLLGENGKKLSKRTGDVAVENFLQKGFLPEAMLNYIALLGWNPKTTKEIFTMSELIEEFSLKNVQRAGAVFDEARMEGFNSEYIKNYDSDTLLNKLRVYLSHYDKEFGEFLKEFDERYVRKIVTELQGRLKTLSEFKALTNFFFKEPKTAEVDLFVNTKMKISSVAEVKQSLKLALEILSEDELDANNPDSIKEIFIKKISESDKKNGQVLWPVRVALSGEQFSPGALELVYILGLKKSIERIQKVLKEL